MFALDARFDHIQQISSNVEIIGSLSRSPTMSELGPDCVKTRMLRFAGAAGWLMKSSLCSDRFANAQNAHDPLHVGGQDV